MKRIYIIQNSLKDDSILTERIKSLGTWLNYFPNSILLRSELSAKQIYERISTGYETDRIFIIEMTKNNFWGVMPTDTWTWIKSDT